MKRLTSYLLALAMVFSMMLNGCSQGTGAETTVDETTTTAVQTVETTEAVEEKLFVAGTYEGAAMGNNDQVTVSVTFGESVIESIQIVSHKETKGISDTALEQMPGKILEAQSLAVDTISGCTNSSNAILNAVKDCVLQAGGEAAVAMLEGREVEKEVSTEKVELTTDIVVVGAGGAGMSAALSASEQDVEILVLEKLAFAGGSTSMSGGLVNAAGTRFQKAMGITEDTIDLHISDTWNRGDQLGDLKMVTLLCNQVIPMMEWLEGYGLQWSEEVQTKPDCTYSRSHTPVRPEGYSGKLGYIITDLMEACLKKADNVEIMFETEVTGILMENGHAVGVIAEGTDGTEYTVKATSVILAAGGFGANGEMVHQYDETIPADCDNSVHPGATGDVLKLAEKIGANLVGMEYIKSLLYSDGATTKFNDAIMVNQEGLRFTNELAKAEVLNAALFQQSGQVYMIYDADVVGEINDKMQKKLNDGDMIMGETLEELAAKIGVNADNLVKTVADYNQMAAGELEDELGRTKFASAIENGPYYAAVPYVQVSYTNGGVQINENMEVISVDGNVIPGLFAAGEITGGVHGSYRVGGNAVAESLTFGKLCGTSAAKYAQK